ncbi:MAG: choice-of-anchor E domain-containing protein [Planctomycetaceae bacterium]|nr:choice-of-anchor E domain-containing protein [Planctomycetaceae bacterium]
MPRPTTILAVWLLLTILRPAQADVITYSASFGPQQFSLGTKVAGSLGSNSSSTLNWNGTLGINFAFPQFDSSMGTLNDVRLTFSGASALTADILFANNQAAPFNQAGINVNMTTNIQLNDASLVISSSDSNFLNTTTTATSSGTPFNLNVGADTLIGPLTSVPLANHGVYLGNGTVTLPMSIQFIAQATTSNGAFAVTPFPVLLMNPVQLSYDFTPTAVPEPSSFVMFAVTTIGVFAARRKRLNNRRHRTVSEQV